VARPLQATRKEIERSIRKNLRGIRRLAVVGVAKDSLASLNEGDWEPELSGEDVEDSEEKERGYETFIDPQKYLRPEVSLMELLVQRRRRSRE
jgi:hypothetical protein